MSLGVLQQEPNPDQTNIPVPTSGSGIWNALKSIFGPFWSFIKWFFEFLINFTINNGVVVAGIILIILVLWLIKIPKLRGILIFGVGVLITLWYVKYGS